MDDKLPDFMAQYYAFNQLNKGAKAELKRVSQPEDLIETPAFYKLLRGDKATMAMQRMLFCLPFITHQDKGISLGEALAKSDKSINEKRLFMVIRSEAPNDLIQLRRLLKLAEPTVDWYKLAKVLYYWNDIAKRQLLEDFFFYQNNDKNSK